MDGERGAAADDGGTGMMAAPFEVERGPDGWRWRLIGPCGRTLAYDSEVYPTDLAAAEAAKAARTAMAERAEKVDEPA